MQKETFFVSEIILWILRVCEANRGQYIISTWHHKIVFSDTIINNQVPRGNQAIKVGLNHQKGVVVQGIMLGELIFMGIKTYFISHRRDATKDERNENEENDCITLHCMCVPRNCFVLQH